LHSEIILVCHSQKFSAHHFETSLEINFRPWNLLEIIDLVCFSYKRLACSVVSKLRLNGIVIIENVRIIGSNVHGGVGRLYQDVGDRSA
jgi:hypothetical protein